MEWNIKLQELRKQKGITQEELARALYVSRTAVSKWESGRGYPNIESLKAIARFFDMTIDELLSSGELLTIAEEDNKRKETQIRDLVFGLLDVSVLLFFFLPFLGQKVDGMVQEVTLLSLTAISPWLRIAFLVAAIGMVVCGVLILALQNASHTLWVKHKIKLSLALNAMGALLFIVSSQPYVAALLFIFLAIKAILLIKQP